MNEESTEAEKKNEEPIVDEEHDQNVRPATSESVTKKTREERSTKVVVRKLPPTMTEEQFLDQIAPLPEYDYFSFVPPDDFDEFSTYSRAYINFVSPDDTVIFSQQFDNYIFVDEKGDEYSAVVEFAPFQRIPKQRNRTKDPLCDTFAEDSKYLEFIKLAGEETQPLNENFFDLPEDKPKEEVEQTPLQEFIANRKKDWDNLREERRKKEIEKRKLKEDMRRISKEKYLAEKAEKLNAIKKELTVVNQTKKNIDIKYKYLKQGIRVKGGKSYQEERLRDLEKLKKFEEQFSISYTKDVETGGAPISSASSGDKQSASILNNINLADEDFERTVEDENDDDNLTEASIDTNDETITTIDNNPDNNECDQTEENDSNITKNNSMEKEIILNGIDHKSDNSIGNKKYGEKRIFDGKARSSSSHSYYDDKKFKSGRNFKEKESRFENKFGKSYKSGDYRKYDSRYESKYTTRRVQSNISNNKSRIIQDKEKIVNLKTTSKDNNFVQCNGTNEDRRSSEEKTKQNNYDNEKNERITNSEIIKQLKESNRAERRIKNKDRPAIEIYRPGMGKFSRQRFEQRKSENTEAK